MKYEIYKQFPEKIRNYYKAYEKLSRYLLKRGIDNSVAMPRRETDNVKIIGRLENNLEFYAEFSNTIFSGLRKEKSQIRGGIYFEDSNKEKAKNIAKLLIDYEL